MNEGAIFALFLVVFYLLPTIIAERRRHRNKSAITALNILLGWTVLGWIIAFVWAWTADVHAEETKIRIEQQPPAQIDPEFFRFPTKERP